MLHDLRQPNRAALAPFMQVAVLLLLATMFAAGAVLRLAWPGDIEYKLDERWTFETARNFEHYATPWVGMPTSQSVANPGLGLWLFTLATNLLDLRDPTQLARVVQWANISALALLFWFAWRVVAPADREAWLWAFALACVNPLAVLFQRKIWPPSILPIFGVMLLICWYQREKRWCAAIWGACGAIIAQVHLPGLFFVAAFALATRLFGRTPTRWRWWALGTSACALPLIPWLMHISQADAGPRENAFKLQRWVEMKFWTHWMTEPFGIGLKYSLQQQFGDFLAQPTLGGRATYLVLALHVGGGAIGLAAIALGVWGLWQRWPMRERAEVSTAPPSAARLACRAGFLGYGLLLTATALPFYRHYLILTFPLMYVWTAYLLLGCCTRLRWELPTRRIALATLCGVQLALSLAFLHYIHKRGGAEQGDYGRTYQSQLEAASTLARQGEATSR